MGQIQPYYRFLLDSNKETLFFYKLWMAAFAQQNQAVAREATGPTKPKIFTIWPFTESLSTFDLCISHSPYSPYFLFTEKDRSNQKKNSWRLCRPHPPSFFIYTYMLCFPHLILTDGLSTCLLRLSPHLCTRPHSPCLFKGIAQKWLHLTLVHRSLSTRSFHQSTN